MTTKYGMFKEPPYLQPGLPPLPDASKPSSAEDVGPKDRDHGLNMKATVGRRGKLNDATFDKFKSVHESDRYVDPLKVRLQANAEKRKGNITDKPFRAASPLKKSATPGDFYGTSGKVPYIPTHTEVLLKKGDVQQPPKGIYTSPAKKGTFGYNKTTLSERQGHKGVATEYEYQHDPETLLHQKRMEEAEADRKARVTDKPFKPSNPPKKGGFGVPGTTISKGKGVVGEWEYVMAPPQDPSAPDGLKKEESTLAFKPSHAFASQRVDKIEYIHDPEAPKLKAASEAKKQERERLAASGPWKPNMSYKTDMVRSIVKMNLR